MAITGVGIENNMYGNIVSTKDGSFEFVPLGRVPKLVKLKSYGELDEVYLRLKFTYGGVKKWIDIPRSQLTRQGILSYASNGLDVFEHTASCLIKVLQLLEQDYFEAGNTIVYYHKQFGWHTVKYAGKEYQVYKHYHFNMPFKSTYEGTYDIKPKGTLKDWCNVVNTHVIGNTPMETMVAVGLSSVLVGYLREDFDYENIFVHLVGDSSCGKTTAASLAVSTGGNPVISKNSLLKTWASTSNAIITNKMGNNGLTVGMDELSMFPYQDLTDLVYRLTNGTEKDRLTKDCKLKEVESFKTTIVSTGEVSLLSKCNNNTGLKARVIELKAKWTTSAENSEAIKAGIQNAYGTASACLADYISSIPKDEIIDLVNDYRALYLSTSKVKELAERMSTKYALILATASLANEALDLNLNVEKILEFLVNNEQQDSETRDIGMNFYEKFVSWLYSNKHHFIVGEQEDTQMRVEVYGKISDCSNPVKTVGGKQIVKQASVRKEALKKMSENYKFQDLRNVLISLRDKGLLDNEKDHLDRKRKINSEFAERVYVINLLAEDESEDDVVNKQLKQQEEDKKNKSKSVRSKAQRMTKGILKD